MRIVILQEDSVVGVDGEFRDNLDLTACGLPENFWALQWGERGQQSGHIEYSSSAIQNDEITELPAWVSACIAVWQAKIDEEAAAQAAALSAAVSAASGQ